MDGLSQLGLSEPALHAYQELIERRAQPGDDSPELTELERAELVHRGEDGRVHANSPRWAVERWIRQEEARLSTVRAAGEQWEEVFRSREHARHPAAEVTGEAVGRVFTEVQAIATQQLRCLERGPYAVSPPTTPDPQQVQRMAEGIDYRVVYDDAVYQQTELRERIYNCVSAGERARALSGVPARMIVADDRMAVLLRRRDGEPAEAVVVEPGMLLDSLVETFEVIWRLAVDIRPPTWERAGVEREPTQATRQLLAHLAAGLTDEAIGREMGVSERTVHRRIRRLQDLLAARTRFQLCLQATRREWI